MPFRSRPIPSPAPFLLLLALLGCAGRASAAEVRFVSLVPAETPGEWLAHVEGIEGAGREGLAFRADGKEVAAVLEGSRFRLRGVPAGMARIEAGSAGKSWRPLAAVRVGAAGKAAAPFDDWVIYHVMMGMFADGSPANDGEITGWRHPNYAGGDLQGVLAHAGHIAELGADAVWLSPVFAARSSHGYDVTNYYRIGDAVAVPDDPAASLDLFRRLVRELGRRGVKVILDVPLNHASQAYERPEGDPGKLRPRATAARQEAEKLWESWGSGYRYWDFGHQPTRRFLREVARHWLEDEGVAGLRLDYVRGVPHDFWAELYAEVKRARPEAFLLGECWLDAEGAEANAREIATYYQPVAGSPQLDSLLDFPMQIAMTEAFARGGAATGLEETLQRSEALYGPGARPTWFLDNHDLARFMAWADRPERLTAALGFMASLSGPIVLFYGTETGLAHGAPKPGFTDAGRIPMPWGKLDAGLVAKVREILRIRREHPALSRGGRLPLAAGKDHLVMAKVAPEETLLVGVNLSGAPRAVELDLAGLLPAGGRFAPVLGEAPAAPGEGGHMRWTLPPLSTSIAAVRESPARP